MRTSISHEGLEGRGTLPWAKVSARRSWRPSLVWVVPLLAAAVAGYVMIQRIAEYGIKVTVRFKDGSGLRAGETAVEYRGIQVGSVQESQLVTNSSAVQIRVSIKRRYAPLVRVNSEFWNVSGVDVRLGLFRGAEINVESLRSLLVGGLAFATPNDANSPPAEDGTVFPLNEEAKKEWLQWAPQIPLESER